MIDRLQESIEKQKQFVADASHELRTPISVIQGYIDLLNRWGKEDREVLEEAIDAIKAETTNMKKLLEELLFLARGDKGEYKFEIENFELSELIAEVYEEMKLIDESRNKETGGAGLGLAIAKWIVDSHSGSIKAKSELNKGTKIIITLPIC
jgi:signal transduction histidine kinase